MEEILRKLGQDDDDLPHWIALVAHLRPSNPHARDEAIANLAALSQLLEQQPALRLQLRLSIARAFIERRTVSLYVSLGLLPSTGFFSETARRFAGRVLPDVADPAYMRDVLGMVFSRVDDEVWVRAIPDAVWAAFIAMLFAPEPDIPTEPGTPPVNSELPNPLLEMIEALRILSYQVSAIGLDPELVRIDPTLEEHESPFMAQNAEVVSYVGHYRTWWHNPRTSVVDASHLEVMLDQCAQVVQRIRKRASKIGTSLSLTFKLERLRQHLERITVLLDLLIRLRSGRTVASIAEPITPLMKTLIRAECRKYKLSDYWSKNLELLSLRMTESASRTGERYIASSHREYFGILGSAALGGLIIAMMAAIKTVLSAQHFPPLSAALTFCLNYGIGFALIHILGGTVATKQPAMTANAIAATIGETRGKQHNLDALADIIVRTIRSQIAAILGNVGVAVPVATLIGALVYVGSGQHFMSPQYAQKMLADVDPLGGTLVFAAIAGVCLFLSGLIAGYYDNLCAYGRIPQRLAQLRWASHLFGAARMQNVARYVQNNLGALAGNFLFGFLLGGVTALGVLFGLPLDIRHIAFSSAYVGYAAIGLEFAIPLNLALWSIAGVLLIGVTNLTVSFALTLSVAMRARQITFAQGQELLRLLLWRFIRRPHEFFLPTFRSPSTEHSANNNPP